MTLPPKGKFVTDSIDEQFIRNVSQLIADFGRNVKFHKKPITQDCPNCGWDNRAKVSNRIYNISNPNALGSLNKPFANGRTCPVCSGKGKLNTPQSENVTCVIIKNTQQLIEMEKEIGERLGSLAQTICEAQHTTVISNVKEATMDGFLYERFSEPVQLGLSKQAFVKTFWRIKR